MAAVDWSTVPGAIRRQLLAHDEQHRRRQIQNRKDHIAMQNQDYKHFVTSAPHKAANIYRSYRDERQAVLNDPMIPAAGQLFRAGELHDQALKDAEALAEQMETAAILARKELVYKRDQTRPKVDAAIHERKARQLAYLADRGVSLDAMIRDYGHDPVTLAVMQDEIPVLARGQMPADPQAPDGPVAVMEQVAYGVYGDQYRQRADAVKDFDRQHYRAKVAVNQVVGHLRRGSSDPLSIPDVAEGQLIEA